MKQKETFRYDHNNKNGLLAIGITEKEFNKTRANVEKAFDETFHTHMLFMSKSAIVEFIINAFMDKDHSHKNRLLVAQIMQAIKAIEETNRKLSSALEKVAEDE